MKAAGYVHVVREDGTVGRYAPGDTIDGDDAKRVRNPAAKDDGDGAFVHPASRPGVVDGTANADGGDDLDDLNLTELRERAAEAEVEGRSKMDRDELVAALRSQ